jgi:hypothetical protein
MLQKLRLADEKSFDFGSGWPEATEAIAYTALQAPVEAAVP